VICIQLAVTAFEEEGVVMLRMHSPHGERERKVPLAGARETIPGHIADFVKTLLTPQANTPRAA
jgi:hypothetical protein